VARATVSARPQRLEDTGVVVGYRPDIDIAATRQLGELPSARQNA
jgi:hypothetical protein